jgi:hypothetical protein
MNKMTNSGVNLWRHLKHASALLMALSVAACGPGTGGSGMSASTILGTYVSSTSLSPSSAPAIVAVPGIALSASPDANYVVVFEAERVTLNNACLVFSSTGVRIESDGQLQIDGLFRVAAPGIDPASAAALPATLVARIDGTGLQVTLRTTAGATLASFGTSAQLPAGSSVVPTGACVAKVG